MSHENPILCVRKEHVTRALGKLEHGLHPVDVLKFAAALEPHLEYRKRSDLETDQAYLHFIPYIVVPRVSVDSVTNQVTTSLMTYKRPVRHPGETSSRVCVAAAGQVELEDKVQYPDSDDMAEDGYISLMETLENCVKREVGEGLGVRVITETADPTITSMFNATIIVDHSDDAGRVRLGMLYTLMVSPGLDMFIAEPHCIELGYKTLGELREVHGHEMEKWSAMVVASLLDAENNFNTQ